MCSRYLTIRFWGNFWCHISHILCPSSMDSARSGCRVWTRQQGIQASYPSAGRCLNAQPLSARENQNLLGPFVRFVMQMLPLRAIIVRFYLPSTLAGSWWKLWEGSYAELCLVSFPFLKMFDILYLNSVGPAGCFCNAELQGSEWRSRQRMPWVSSWRQAGRHVRDVTRIPLLSTQLQLHSEWTFQTFSLIHTSWFRII